MALVVVLSALNGIEGLVSSMYSSFDSDIKISPKKGKSFSIDEFPKDKILAIPVVKNYSEIIEEVVILHHKDQFDVDQYEHATIKGVEEDFLNGGLKEKILHGTPQLNYQNESYGIIGSGLLLKLGGFIPSINQEHEHISVFAPSRRKKIKHNNNSFNKESLKLSSSFFIGPEFDFKYLIAPIDFARDVLDYGNGVSAVEIGLIDNSNEESIKQEIQKMLGDDFQIKTSYEQNEIIYKTNKTEKLITFLILCFIFILATFNIIASLTMLILDKKKDIFVLKSMGATSQMIRRIFFTEGLLINLLGGIIGIGLGYIICIIQQQFHFIKMEGTIIDYFPIKVKWNDLVIIFSAVFLIGCVSSWLPTKYIIKRHFDQFDISN